MCLYPRIIKNRKYTKTKKNGGIIPAISDIRVMAVPVGCGRCMECRKQEARKWQLRLQEDIRTNKNGIMTTLTFSNESIKELVKAIEEAEITEWEMEKRNGEMVRTGRSWTKKKWEVMPTGYELDNEIATIATRRFTERWRKIYGKTIRHWFITELGHTGTENIHMHGIVWTDEPKEEIKKQWGYGYTWEGDYVNERTVNYIIKYVHKQDKDHKEYRPKVLASKGIGKAYTERIEAEGNKYNGEDTREYYRTRSGKKVALPVYWRNKIYTEEEREKLWISKLDKEERWVNGLRIDISQGTEEYYKVLETAREKNRIMGYGTNQVDWNRKRYEEERRILLTARRIEDKDSLRGLGDAPESAESINNSLRSQGAIKPNENW